MMLTVMDNSKVFSINFYDTNEGAYFDLASKEN